jgi:hypothetical protein
MTQIPVGTEHTHDPTTDAGYTTAGASQTAQTIDQFLAHERAAI